MNTHFLHLLVNLSSYSITLGGNVMHMNTKSKNYHKVNGPLALFTPEQLFPPRITYSGVTMQSLPLYIWSPKDDLGTRSVYLVTGLVFAL